MCRSIKTLRNPIEQATDEDVRAAALQFVRKISGYRVPSLTNEQVFNQAVDDIAIASRVLLDSLSQRRQTPNAQARTAVVAGGLSKTGS